MAGQTRMISCSWPEFNSMFGVYKYEKDGGWISHEVLYEFVRWDTPIQVYCRGTCLAAILAPANGGPMLQVKINNPRICFKKDVGYTFRQLREMGCDIYGATTCSGDYFIEP